MPMRCPKVRLVHVALTSLKHLPSNREDGDSPLPPPPPSLVLNAHFYSPPLPMLLLRSLSRISEALTVTLTALLRPRPSCPSRPVASLDY